MADTRPYRGGVCVVYQEHVYRSFQGHPSSMIPLCVDEGASPPDGLDSAPLLREGVYLVDFRSVTAWYSSSWTFRWKGELFDSGGVRDGRIHGYYRGTKGAAFADAHLIRMGAIEYEGTFPLEEVTDLTETRVDLLARWKEGHPE
jgi:hypothetical protein